MDERLNTPDASAGKPEPAASAAPESAPSDKAGSENAAQSGNKRERFFKSSFYDTGDIGAQAERAYRADMPEDERRKQLRRDWLMLLLGIPALIGLYFLIAAIFKS